MANNEKCNDFEESALFCGHQASLSAWNLLFIEWATKLRLEILPRDVFVGFVSFFQVDLRCIRIETG